MNPVAMNRGKWAVPIAVMGLAACTSTPAEVAFSTPPAADAGDAPAPGFGQTPAPWLASETRDPWGVSEVSLPGTVEEAEALLAGMPDYLATADHLATAASWQLGEGPALRGLSAYGGFPSAYIEYSAKPLIVAVHFDWHLEDLIAAAQPRRGGPYLTNVTGHDYDSPGMAWHTGTARGEYWEAMFFDPVTETTVIAWASTEQDLDALVTEFVTASTRT